MLKSDSNALFRYLEVLLAGNRCSTGKARALFVESFCVVNRFRKSDRLGQQFNRPENVAPVLQLGIAYENQGALESALAVYAEGISLHPGSVELLVHYATVLSKLGRYDEATLAFEKAGALAPQSILYLLNHGCHLRATNNPEAALQSFYLVLALDPYCGLAYLNLGHLYFSIADYQRALEQYEQVITLEPGNEQAYLSLSYTFKAFGQPSQELAALKRLTDHKPDSVLGWSKLAIWYESASGVTDARLCYETLQRLEPENPLWPLKQACLFFPVLEDTQEAHAQCATLLIRLEQLRKTQTGLTVSALFDARFSSPFNLTYYNMDDLQIRSALAETLIDACQIQHASQTVPALENRKIKIGFLVTENHERIFERVTGQLIRQLNPERFEVFIVCPQSRVNGVASLFSDVDHLQYWGMLDTIHELIEDLQSANLDILFFYEIGTGVKNYLLSLYRFAPLQVTSWGYPVSSGSPAIDYYISSVLTEPPDAQAYYREKLALLETLPCCYPAIQLPESFKSRAELNLPENRRIYACVQTLLKFHPDFDAALAGILASDPDGEVVLVEGLEASWTEALQARLSRTLGADYQRIRFLPKLSYQDYLSLLKVSDVLLDTFHFGGGLTAYEAMAIGTPVITLPGKQMKGRFTLGCYQKLEISDCIAESTEHYVQLATTIAKDASLRQSISQRILERNQRLFGETSVVGEFERFFEQALREKLVF